VGTVISEQTIRTSRELICEAPGLAHVYTAHVRDAQGKWNRNGSMDRPQNSQVRGYSPWLRNADGMYIM
jgi:hypothetical protein